MNKTILGLLVFLVIPFVTAQMYGDCDGNDIIEIPDLSSTEGVCQNYTIVDRELIRSAIINPFLNISEIRNVIIGNSELDLQIVKLVVSGFVSCYDNTFECSDTQKCVNYISNDCDGNNIIEIPDKTSIVNRQCDNITASTKIICEADFVCNNFGTCNQTNIEPCLEVIDNNTCLDFNGNIGDYNRDCVYVAPVVDNGGGSSSGGSGSSSCSNSYRVGQCCNWGKDGKPEYKKGKYCYCEYENEDDDEGTIRKCRDSISTSSYQETCVPKVECEDFGECINGTQTSMCRDSSHCGNVANKEQACDIPKVIIEEPKKDYTWNIVGLCLLLIFICGIILFLTRKKEKKLNGGKKNGKK